MTEEHEVVVERREPTIHKSFRVTQSEAQRIDEVAEKNGVTLSVIVRNGLKAIGILDRV